MKETDILGKLLSKYLDVEYYALEELGVLMRTQGLSAEFEEQQKLFRTQLRDALDVKGLVSPRNFERWTNVDTETQEEVQARLQEIWDECFEKSKGGETKGPGNQDARVG